jgi:chromosome segregation ATPase
MDQASNIIEMLQKQAPLEEIENELQWGKLTQADFEKLFAEADRLKDSKTSLDLLGLMYKAAKDRDFWLETRILAAVIARSEADIEGNKLLKRMSFCLEQIRTSISKVHKSDALQLRYRRYLCDYVSLSARLLEETGDIENALNQYIAAQKAYTEYNFLVAAKEMDEPIARLQRYKKQGDQLVTVQSLVDRKSLLDKQIADLEIQLQGKSHQLEDSDAQLKSKEAELQNLNLIIEELDNRLESNQKSLQKIKEETKELEKQKEISKALLEQVEQEKVSLVEEIITLRGQAQELDIRVAQTSLKINDRLAALQAQIDLKEAELEKVDGGLKQKTSISSELNQSILVRRQELATLEETIHHDEGYINELSKRRTQFESESNPEQIMKDEPVIEDTTDQSQGELAIKLERYKKNLKASRLRKKGASDESR